MNIQFIDVLVFLFTAVDSFLDNEFFQFFQIHK